MCSEVCNGRSRSVPIESIQYYFCNYKKFESLAALELIIGRTASEEVTLKIIKSKCLPLLLEVCPLTVSDLRSLDFVINRFFMKLFCTNVMDTVKI